MPTDIRGPCYPGAEIRVVGLLRRGGGDEEEVDDDDPLKPDEWLPRESWLIHLCWNYQGEQIMRIKQKLDAQARSDAIELGGSTPSPTKTARCWRSCGPRGRRHCQKEAS